LIENNRTGPDEVNLKSSPRSVQLTKPEHSAVPRGDASRPRRPAGLLPVPAPLARRVNGLTAPARHVRSTIRVHAFAFPFLSSPPLPQSHPFLSAEAGETSKPKEGKKKAVTFNSIPSSPPESERRRRSRQLPASGGYLVRRTISAVLCHSGTELPAQAALAGSPRGKIEQD
jgi:hypothetical protein